MLDWHSCQICYSLEIKILLLLLSCIRFLRQLHLDLNMCCFINFTLKLHFSIKKSSVRLLLLYVDVETFGGN